MEYSQKTANTNSRAVPVHCAPKSTFSRSEAVPASNAPPLAFSEAAAHSPSTSLSSLSVHTSVFVLAEALLMTTCSKPRDISTHENESAGTTLLQYAIVGNICGIEALITAGVNVNVVDEVGLSAIMYAAVCGHRNIVKALLSLHATTVMLSKGIAALVKRVSTAEAEVGMLEALFRVNWQLRDREGAEGKESEGSDMEEKGGWGDEADGEANDVGDGEGWGEEDEDHADEDCAEWKWDGDDGDTNGVLDEPLLFWAVESGYVDVVKLLLAAGVDVYERYHGTKTALHVAAAEGYAEIVALLLAASDAGYADATADICTALGWSHDWTALHVAAQSGHVTVVEMLLSGEADVYARNSDGESAIHLAAEAGHVDVVKVLLAAGVEVDARDHDGWSALHNASQHGHISIVKILLVAGADLHLTDDDGWSALHTASQWGRVEVVNALLLSRADVHAQANDGATALHLASQQGRVDVIELLLNAWTSVPVAAALDG